MYINKWEKVQKRLSNQLFIEFNEMTFYKFNEHCWMNQIWPVVLLIWSKWLNDLFSSASENSSTTTGKASSFKCHGLRH